MTKVRDIIRDSLMLLGVIAPGETLDGEDGLDCLRRLNAMLSAWSTERLMIYTIDRNVYPLSIGVQDYTMGPGGTLASTRPVSIKNASVIPTASDATLEIPIKIIWDEEWQGISVKNVQSTFPTHVYPRGGSPLSTLQFWPVPSQTCSVVLYTWSQLTSFTSLDQDVSLPPGWEEMIVYNLSPRLSPMYGKQAPPEVAALAVSSRQRVKTINTQVPVLRADQSWLTSRSTSAKANSSSGLVID